MHPTREQLDRYMDLVVDGHEPDDAILVVFGESEPERPTEHNSDVVAAALAEQRRPKPAVMITEFPDGVVIGWDTCAIGNNGCGKHVSRCSCKSGPKELKVFAHWREDTSTMPDYAAASRAATRQGVPDSVPLGAGNAGVVVATQPAGTVQCVLHDGLVPQEDADVNDDGTYSCFTCQEAGIQRGVQVDG